MTRTERAAAPVAHTSLVSILMPAYDVAPFAARAVESILQQSHVHWELLLADDASTDATREILDSFLDPRIRRLDNPHHLGYLKTCNRLFAECAGEYVTFQDADDYSAPERMERQLAAFREDPDLGICGTRAAVVNAQGRLIAHDRRPTTDADLRAEVAKRNVFCGATLMVPARVLQTVGGYREFFEDYSHQDYDWAYRILEKFKAKNLPEELYFYRQREGSNSKRIDVRRVVGQRLAQALAQQRVEKGSDVLMSADAVAADALVAGLVRPYQDDPALLYREFAAGLLYGRLYRQAVRSAALAVVHGPRSLLNYRTLFYCLRRSAAATVGR